MKKIHFCIRPAFTLAEMVIVMVTLAIAAGISVPMYNRYAARNGMEIARQNIAQGLERAKLLSQIGMNDSAWGFSTTAIPGRGVLFMGDSFLDRDTSFDEMYSIPSNLTVVGIDEVVFERVTGIPNVTGTITVTSPYNESTTVSVNLGSTGQVDVPEDWFEVCVEPYGSDPQTIRVPDSLWITYQQDGALLGGCSEVPLISSSSSSTGLSNGGNNFSITDGTITLNDTYKMKIDKVGTALNISSGYAAPITIRYKINGPFLEPWGDFEKPVDGNINTDEDFTYTTDFISAGSTIDVWSNSFYKKKSWYSGTENNHFNLKQHVKTPDDDGLVQYLLDGDEVPTYTGAGGQPDIEVFLEQYIDPDTGLITLPPYQALFFFELWTTDVSNADADFQDLVLLITFLDS